MEIGKMGSSSTITSNKEEQKDDLPLPGFRFHPTDEELVGFYLRRKIEKRPITLDLIKLADIYKYDPWDLPKSSDFGDEEMFFFCKRGRKYRNSIRPNRVTGSGFWKATGIDRPIYSSGTEGLECIGLKKSLVYYRGRAGKGTKTDWMMHEFRLPASHDHKRTKHMHTKSIDQEAEIWTLCRIFKRNVSYRKIVQGKRNTVDPTNDAFSKSNSSDQKNGEINCISFRAPVIKQIEKKPYNIGHVENIANQGYCRSLAECQAPSVVDSCFTSSACGDINELLMHTDWEDLRYMLDYASTTTNPLYDNYHEMLHN